MENNLPLRSFEIEGYRAIRHLRLPQLERVNLFVGFNNAGKTSLLEGLRLYANSISLTSLSEIIRERSGLRLSTPAIVDDIAPVVAEATMAFDAVTSLFHGTYSGSTGSIRLGPTDAASHQLELTLPWTLNRSGDGDFVPSDEIVAEPSTPLVQLRQGVQKKDYSLGMFLRGAILRHPQARSRAEFIPAQGLRIETLAALWERTAESGHASLVEDAVRVIVPDLERCYLLGRGKARRILMQMRGVARPVPITNMGDGTNRVFGIALALVAAQGGVLLIDEVENGLHHAVQADVWSAIFTLAERLRVQVFATTHSWDAVVGFQAAANQSSARGLLYRLEREADGEIYAERYTEEEVAVAADQQVEVR
ncbi:MAG TPA: ATP-binding protein [Longimicrobium sp.]|jgi:predicted ATPase